MSITQKMAVGHESHSKWPNVSAAVDLAAVMQGKVSEGRYVNMRSI